MFVSLCRIKEAGPWPLCAFGVTSSMDDVFGAFLSASMSANNERVGGGGGGGGQ